MNYSLLLSKVRCASLLTATSRRDLTQASSLERQKRVAWTALTAAAAKAAALLVMLITVPLTLNYLGPERYGLWMAITGIVAWVGFADLGVGNGILNATARAYGKDDYVAIRKTMSNGLAILGVLGLTIAIIVVVSKPLVPWAAFFNVKTELAAREAGGAVVVLVLCLAIAMPLIAVQQVQLGVQQGFVSNTWQLFGSLVALGGVTLAIQLHAGLPWIVLAISGAPVFALLLNALYFSSRSGQALYPIAMCPTLADLDKQKMSSLIKTGSLFFILQIASVVGYQSDNFIIARILGPEAVTEYAVAMKLFSLPPLLIGMFLTPLWPAYGEAAARGDMAWVRKAFKISVIASAAVSVPVTLGLIVFADPLIVMWIGPSVSPSSDLVVGMGVWSVMAVFGGCFAVLLNALHAVKFQVVTAVLMAVANVGLSIYLVSMIGTVGAILGSILATALFITFPYIFYIARILKSTR